MGSRQLSSARPRPKDNGVESEAVISVSICCADLSKFVVVLMRVALHGCTMLFLFCSCLLTLFGFEIQTSERPHSSRPVISIDVEKERAPPLSPLVMRHRSRMYSVYTQKACCILFSFPSTLVPCFSERNAGCGEGFISPTLPCACLKKIIDLRTKKQGIVLEMPSNRVVY